MARPRGVPVAVHTGAPAWRVEGGVLTGMHGQQQQEHGCARLDCQ